MKQQLEDKRIERFKHSTIDDLVNPLTNKGINTINAHIPYDIAEILGYGFKCAVPPRKDINTYIKEVDDFEITLLRQTFFAAVQINNPYNDKPDTYIKNPWKLPSSWVPDDYLMKKQHAEKQHYMILNLINKIKQDLPKLLKTRTMPFNTITNTELRMIHQFSLQNNIVIQNADKGLGITVIDKDWYLQQGDKLLNNHSVEPNYTLTPIDMANHITNTTKNLLKEKTQLLLNKSLAAYLLYRCNVSSKYPVLYLMPKLHKQPIGIRPIVAGHSYFLTPAAKIASVYWRYLYMNSRIIVQDTRTVINQLANLTFPSQCILATADVSNLYGEIPIPHLLHILNNSHIDCNNIKNVFPEVDFKDMDKITDNKYKLVDSHDRYHSVMRYITELTLTCNFVIFNNNIYQQNKGVAMGSPLGPTMANVYLNNEVDQVIVNNTDILYAGRYLDDILMILSPHTDTDKLVATMNNIDPYMKFTFNFSHDHVEFLDMDIHKANLFGNQTSLLTRTFVKPNNKLLYLPYKSFHTLSNKLGFIITELIRIIRISSTIDYFTETAITFTQALRKRGYPCNFILQALSRVDYNKRAEYLRPRPTNTTLNKAKNVQHPYFISHLDYYTRDGDLKRMLKKHFATLPPNDRIIQLININDTVISLRKSPSLYQYVVHNKSDINMNFNLG